MLRGSRLGQHRPSVCPGHRDLLLGEPPFVASAEQAWAFFVNGSQGWVQAATALTSLAAIGLIWFVVGLSLLPIEAVYWLGFALPIPWLLGAAAPRLWPPPGSTSNDVTATHAPSLGCAPLLRLPI
jgi:hypothetical protein